MQALLPIHIVAGGLAILLGSVALLARKGRGLHRRSGGLFVYAMVTMGISASILALRHGLANPNFLGGLTSVYFVVTGVVAVRQPSIAVRRVAAGAMCLAFALALLEVSEGVQHLAAPQVRPENVMLFVMAAIALAAGLGDLRVLRSSPLRGAARLRRHLWRMSFALFIASASFFSIRARVANILPEPFLSGPRRAVPVLLVLFAMCYWLWRVGRKASRPLVRSATATAQSV